MTDENTNIKKMRARIERDAYNVLLSFKSGATARQVEQRMDETLGYTYVGKYYQAGVRDMHQILTEHREIEKIDERNFKIVANENNQDLVALISKQKDNNKKKKGVVSQKGRRAFSSLSYHGFYVQSSPKRTVRRAPESQGRSNNKKHLSNTSIPANGFSNASYSRPSTSSGFGIPERKSKIRYAGIGTTSCLPTATNKPLCLVPPAQRPLQRPSTSSSVSISSIPGTSRSLIYASPPPPQSRKSNHMPSIKEFSENAKRIMLIAHPTAVHLSELTDLYEKEYGVSVDPLQMFSKSWKMIVTTTFKDWICLDNEGQVSLKADWFQKCGSKLKSAIVNKSDPNANSKSESYSISQSCEKPNNLLPLSDQGFRYQVPALPKPVMKKVSKKMDGNTLRGRVALLTPEKPPGLVQKSSEHFSSRMVKSPLIKKTSSFCEIENYHPISNPSFSSQRTVQTSAVSELNYDSNQLKDLKKGKKYDETKLNIKVALKDLPEIKKKVKKDTNTPSWNSVSRVQITSNANTSTSSKGNRNTISSASCLPSTQPRARSSVKNRANSVIFERAVADIRIQNGYKSLPKYSNIGQKALYVVHSPPTPTISSKEDSPLLTRTDSDDDWEEIIVPATQEITAPVRPLLLPPMSKGTPSIFPPRSRSVSCRQSASSCDTIQQALNAELPSDSDNDW